MNNAYKLISQLISSNPNINASGLEQIIIKALCAATPDVISKLQSNPEFRTQCIDNILNLIVKNCVNINLLTESIKFSGKINTESIINNNIAIITEYIDNILVLYRTSDNYLYKTSDGYLINFKYGRTTNI